MLLHLKQAKPFNPQRPASCRVLVSTASAYAENYAADNISAKCWQLISWILVLPRKQMDVNFNLIHILEYTHTKKNVHFFRKDYKLAVHLTPDHRSIVLHHSALSLETKPHKNTCYNVTLWKNLFVHRHSIGLGN